MGGAEGGGSGRGARYTRGVHTGAAAVCLPCQQAGRFGCRGRGASSGGLAVLGLGARAARPSKTWGKGERGVVGRSRRARTLPGQPTWGAARGGLRGAGAELAVAELRWNIGKCEKGTAKGRDSCFRGGAAAGRGAGRGKAPRGPRTRRRWRNSRACCGRWAHITSKPFEAAAAVWKVMELAPEPALPWPIEATSCARRSGSC